MAVNYGFGSHEMNGENLMHAMGGWCPNCGRKFAKYEVRETSWPWNFIENSDMRGVEIHEASCNCGAEFYAEGGEYHGYDFSGHIVVKAINPIVAAALAKLAANTKEIMERVNAS